MNHMTDQPDIDLLSAEGAILTDPAMINHALTTMWKSAHQIDTAKTGGKVASRICIANLIVMGYTDNWPHLGQILGELSLTYPTRSIVVLITDSNKKQPIRATVSAICHLPRPDRPQVCCEQIVLRCSSCHCQDLDRIILPLLASDLQTMLWWRIDPTTHMELLYQLQLMADRLIFDAGPGAFGFLEAIGRCETRELGWYRTAQRRTLIAQMFDESPPGSLDHIEQITIAISGNSIEDRIDACWLTAFIGGQLGWQPSKVIAPACYEFKSAKRNVQVNIISCQANNPGMQSFTITSGTDSYTMVQCPDRSDEFRIILHNQQVCQLPRCIQVRRIQQGQTLPAAFSGRPADPAFNRAVPLAVWLANTIKCMD